MDWNPSERPVWKRPVTFAVVALALVGFGVFAYLQWFAPQGTTTVQQNLDGSDAMAGEDMPEGYDATLLASGTWRGDDGHHASGTVGVYTDEEGAFLFFEDYEATSGPDVYLYVSTDDDGQWRSGSVTKVPVPGGAKDGQATLRGDFRIPLPDDVDPHELASVHIWCDRFSVHFGHAIVT